MPTILRWILIAVPWLAVLVIIMVLAGAVFRIPWVIDAVKSAECVPRAWMIWLLLPLVVSGMLTLAAGQARRDRDQVEKQTIRSWLKPTLTRRFATPRFGDPRLWTRAFLSLVLLASFFRC